ncbi:hypothetical protein ST201phi2-1p086 [Pseudomonas phage 201phi2-1]|uniref:Uncharacterized protein n=1 Tax=Pseudomonas phage 201phi2-1 TaxID=198110 RepID=B3FK61_BP201|nr:hypothetical protein ST201phi2-1p086 [Pseudomonas phage 201phi2-1]ABY62919.1 hypothetical protein 201phi2-1p086 [Pseudomonas phage 201phi2-1]
MKTFEEDIDKLCDQLDDCISGVGINMEAIAKTVRLLEYLRNEAVNLEYTSEANIQALLHEVIS